MTLAADSLDSIHLPGTWLTIGSFDGVHLGHQALVGGMVQAAHQTGASAVVVTFYPHPARVLGRIDTPFYLTAPEKRTELLSALGVDAVVTLTFDHALASQPAAVFITRLKTSLDFRQLWAGARFTLGHHREGDVVFLQHLGKVLSYDVHVVAPVSVAGEVVSSSAIRRRLSSGNVGQAAAFLGRPYSVLGKVVHGDGRGRSLGIPTANLAVWSEQLLPAEGVYACRAQLDEQHLAAVVNIGVRPTFKNVGEIAQVEAHLLDFSGDIYGQSLLLEFISRLRPEQHFPSVAALVEQIQDDISSARRLLQ